MGMELLWLRSRAISQTRLMIELFAAEKPISEDVYFLPG